MGEACRYCDAEITEAGFIKAANTRLSQRSVDIVNFIHGTDYAGLCEKCGTDIWNETIGGIQSELDEKKKFYNDHIVDFPMMTISLLPNDINFKVKALVTANITVGTGFFNEFSQGISDIFGTISSTSGMAYKVNSGEAAARSILVQKAIGMGANAIIGIDIDYGTTANNAAIVNMQGTAIKIDDLERLVDAPEAERAFNLTTAVSRIAILQRWQRGDFSEKPEPA